MVKLRQPITAGIDEENVSMATISPNPSSGLFHIHLPAPTDALLTVTDMVGREVRRERVNSTSVALDLSDQARGCYLLTLRTEHDVRSQRLLLE